MVETQSNDFEEFKAEYVKRVNTDLEADGLRKRMTGGKYEDVVRKLAYGGYKR